jgi:hypothetical protein
MVDAESYVTTSTDFLYSAETFLIQSLPLGQQLMAALSDCGKHQIFHDLITDGAISQIDVTQVDFKALEQESINKRPQMPRNQQIYEELNVLATRAFANASLDVRGFWQRLTGQLEERLRDQWQEIQEIAQNILNNL